MKTTRVIGLIRKAVIIFAATAFLLPANADPILSLSVGPLMEPMQIQDASGEDMGGGNNRFEGQTSMEGMWSLTYDVMANEDPFINAQFAFQNTSGMTQQFVLSASVPISPAVLPSSLVGGSFGGSLTDANFDGSATLSTVMGSPMYNGGIDGTGVLPIYSHPYSLSASSFAGQTVNIPAVNVGLPGPTIPGPAGLNTIGVEHIFTLTPGDSISFTSFFVVEAIPEPASLGLLALISGGIYFSRRFFTA